MPVGDDNMTRPDQHQSGSRRRHMHTTALCLAASAITLACTSSEQSTPTSTASECATPPALSADINDLSAALNCPNELAQAARAPVLLVPGTALEPDANFGWNYIPALEAREWPYCTITLPERAMGDIQIAAEYVVYAIREMYERGGHPIQILGFSQGGMTPRWALKYWPDTRDMVEEVVGLAPSNHGTVTAQPQCQIDCPTAFRQQKNDSKFIATLNADIETFEGIDYSNLHSWFDEVVTPNTPPSPSSALSGGDNVANIALQDICPGNAAEHLATGSYDGLAAALAFDALKNDGPADPSRIDISVCAAPLMDGVNPTTFANDYADMVAFISASIEGADTSTDEPPIACYAEAD